MIERAAISAPDRGGPTPAAMTDQPLPAKPRGGPGDCQRQVIPAQAVGPSGQMAAADLIEHRRVIGYPD